MLMLCLPLKVCLSFIIMGHFHFTSLIYNMNTIVSRSTVFWACLCWFCSYIRTYWRMHSAKQNVTLICCKCSILYANGVSSLPSEIEFNLTGSYGSPIHTNHNSNYSSMPSPDMDQSERKQQHDQSRRPLSVATDNMMLEFYKKDGYDAKCILLLPTSHSLYPSLCSSLSTHASFQASDIEFLYLRKATLAH